MAIDKDVIKRTIKESEFISIWKNEMNSTMRQIHPEWDEKEIDKVLDKMLKEQLQIPEVTLDNNFTGECRDSNLISVFDWVLKRKPLVAGNGTFYKNQHEAINPVATMLDGFLKKRKAIKKRMFTIEDTTSDLYKDLDRGQQNEKILANSYYGASGMAASPFYSKWSGPATTGTAQSVISTTETMFESFLVDNYKFIEISECYWYMNFIINQDYELPDFVVRVSKDDLLERIKNMFYDDIWQDEYNEALYHYINHLDIEDVSKIYYKNNFIEFTRRHPHILKLYDKMFMAIENLQYAESIDDIPLRFKDKFVNGDNKQLVKDYNSFVNNQYFMDPNSPPDTIKEYLVELNKLYMDCVYVPMMVFDRIHRLKYFNRKTVCIVDTDSNILALDRWVEFCENEVLLGDYGRSKENNRFIIVNAMAYFITNAVSDVLNEYGLHSYIPDEYRPRFNMKNEFYFNKLVIGKKKKRYISSIKLREGNLITPYKPDVKGFEFMKSATSEYAKKRFDSIVKRYILESDIPNTPAILGELKAFEDEIRNSILSGDTTYLPLASAKDLDAYKDPYTQQGVRGSIAWNLIYPDNAISYPSKVSVLKLNIFSPEDIQNLQQTNPREYNIIMNDIFNSPNKKLADKGLQVIAIPTGGKIPEWCMQYVDMNTAINNIISQFKGVLDIFGIDSPEVGKSVKSVNRKTKKFSNIVRF